MTHCREKPFDNSILQYVQCIISYFLKKKKKCFLQTYLCRRTDLPKILCLFIQCLIIKFNLKCLLVGYCVFSFDSVTTVIINEYCTIKNFDKFNVKSTIHLGVRWIRLIECHQYSDIASFMILLLRCSQESKLNKYCRLWINHVTNRRPRCTPKSTKRSKIHIKRSNSKKLSIDKPFRPTLGTTAWHYLGVLFISRLFLVFFFAKAKSSVVSFNLAASFYIRLKTHNKRTLSRVKFIVFRKWDTFCHSFSHLVVTALRNARISWNVLFLNDSAANFIIR